MSDEFWLGASTLGPGTAVPGIRRFTLSDEGLITLGSFTAAGENPMFLAHLRDELAIVHELEAGRVSVLRPGDGAPARDLPGVATGAADPCHVVAAPDGESVIVANYSGGAVTVHSVVGGDVEAPRLSIRYAGSGPDTDRQQSSHPHQIVIDEQRDVIYVPDLGTDSIHVHRLSALLEGDEAHTDIALAPGSGPRHLVIDGDVLLVANELDRTVVAIDATTGETVATAPATARPGATDDPGTSAIRLTSTGHVFVGNRGPGTVGLLRWDRSAHTLTYLDEVACGGEHPRDLETTADGRFVIVANQWSDQLSVLQFDPATEQLTLTDTVQTPSPACVLRAGAS